MLGYLWKLLNRGQNYRNKTLTMSDVYKNFHIQNKPSAEMSQSADEEVNQQIPPLGKISFHCANIFLL